MHPYTREGLYGGYFSGANAVGFDKLMTVFDFKEITNDPKLMSVILQILLKKITNRFVVDKDRRTPFMIIVDEAWTLLDFAAGFFARFGRTVRRYGGSLVVCAQSFKDLQKSEYHKTILENSTWKILFPQNESDLIAFRESEEFKDMIPLIRSVGLLRNKYAEALFYTTGVAVIGKLVLDDYSKTLFSTDPLDFNFLRKKTTEGISLDEAIEESVLQKKSKQNN